LELCAVRTTIVLLFLAICATAFSAYWFDPHIAAARAWASLIDDASKSTTLAEEMVVSDGIHSKRATAALATSIRKVFIMDCANRHYASNKTTIQQWNLILSQCQTELMEQDQKSQELTGHDYGWTP
jgi:hypothetical protein